jgi:putative NADH-flavin reductase
MTRILILGATRGIGLACVHRALEQGAQVRAFARSADRMELDHPDLETVAGDATDAAALQAALPGCDAVIQALGVPIKTAAGPAKRTTLFSDSTRALVAAMAETGPARLVAVTGYGAGDGKARMSAAERAAQRLALGSAYADKDVQEEIIKGSDLDWLILRPGILTNGARKGTVQELRDPASWRNGLISRADVADICVREAMTPTLHRETPTLVY